MTHEITMDPAISRADEYMEAQEAYYEEYYLDWWHRESCEVFARCQDIEQLRTCTDIANRTWEAIHGQD